MSDARTAAIDFEVIEGFLDPDTCVSLREELTTTETHAARVHAASEHAVRYGTRNTKSVVPRQSTRDLIAEKLRALLPFLAQRFDVALTSVEPAQFLRYEPGDFFVAHQDGNTPLVHDDSRFRKVSIVIFLSDPSSYEGGAFVFHGRYPDYALRLTAPAAAGSLLAFRSETTHEVTPVTRGERYSVVSWLRGDS